MKLLVDQILFWGGVALANFAGSWYTLLFAGFTAFWVASRLPPHLPPVLRSATCAECCPGCGHTAGRRAPTPASSAVPGLGIPAFLASVRRWAPLADHDGLTPQGRPAVDQRRTGAPSTRTHRSPRQLRRERPRASTTERRQ